jgi:hypothetical protein
VGPLGGPAIANLPGAVWETPAFIDLMADAMLTREAVERRRVALAAGGADGALRPLVRSATDVGRALGQLAMPTSLEEAEALGDARQALVGLGDLALACPAGSRDNKRFLVWIEEVVDRVRNTPVGRSLLPARRMVHARGRAPARVRRAAAPRALRARGDQLR